jgi:phosphohistidine phosphatase
MPRRLLLLRHGVAEDAGPATGHRDEPRALTEEGARRMRRAARGMRRLGVEAGTVLTSPLVRCRQTAEIVCEELGGSPEDDDRLRPGLELDELENVLIDHPGDGPILICGHQPDLSLLVAALTGGGLADFRKGTLAVLDLDAPRPAGARLRALYPPDMLRRLGKS